MVFPIVPSPIIVSIDSTSNLPSPYRLELGYGLCFLRSIFGEKAWGGIVVVMARWMRSERALNETASVMMLV
jgi:hypothetical protein